MPSHSSHDSIQCPSCGQKNPGGFAFCGHCGTALKTKPPVSSPPPPAVASSDLVYRARLTLLLEDGSPGGSLDLEGGPITFGRDYGPPFDQDFYLNPQHCAFTVLKDGLYIEELNPINGIYQKLDSPVELRHGDVFRVGQELLGYEDLPEASSTEDQTERIGSPNPGYWGRVSVIVENSIAFEAFPIANGEFTIGREQGDLRFPSDGYVSSQHCRVVGNERGIFLEDTGSSNGTYIRLRSGSQVPFGSLILVGQQLFHIGKI